MTGSRIADIHAYFFNENNLPSNDEIVKCYEDNRLIIDSANVDSQSYEQVLRIKCEYCYALNELKQYKKALSNIIEVEPMFSTIYSTEDSKFGNAFYIKLIWNRMLSNFHNYDYANCVYDIKNLLKYFPENVIYQKWDLVIKSKIRRGKFINGFYKLLKIK